MPYRERSCPARPPAVLCIDPTHDGAIENHSAATAPSLSGTTRPWLRVAHSQGGRSTPTAGGGGARAVGILGRSHRMLVAGHRASDNPRSAPAKGGWSCLAVSPDATIWRV